MTSQIDPQKEQNGEYRLFGRRQDRPLKARQIRLMETLLPDIAINAEDVDAILATKKELWLEIGFGGGEHLVWQAAQNPDVLCIGAEPFLNGVAKLLCWVEDGELSNIRILHGDARPLVEALPANILTRVFVLHPDPWPKKKHFKRRIISPFLLARIAYLLKSGGVFRVASDIPDYVRWTLMQVQRHNREMSQDFRWQAQVPGDWREAPTDWPQTRYEAKALREGRVPTYLEFTKL